MEAIQRYHKVINEGDFLPLEVLHYLLIQLKLGRHYRDEFRLTKRGAALAVSSGQLFAELIPFYVLRIDHSSYSRLDERPFGKWDVWLNVINWEADHGSTEAQLYKVFYGEDHDWHNSGWRELAAFSAYVLKPLQWAGLLVEHPDDGKRLYHIFKTPLWRNALKLDLDDQLKPMTVQ